MTLHGIDAVEVGARLRGAREAAGLTQTDVAAELHVARTTLVAMEQGRRRVRTDELQRLARLYGTSVNALLRREAVPVDLVPRFRKLWTANDEAMERAARLMTDLVRAEVELENLLGITRTRTDDQACEVPGRTATVDDDAGDEPRPVSLRLGLLAAEAERRELLSEGQLARLLCLDRVELRKILDAADTDGNDTDGPSKPLR